MSIEFIRLDVKRGQFGGSGELRAPVEWAHLTRSESGRERRPLIARARRKERCRVQTRFCPALPLQQELWFMWSTLQSPIFILELS